MGKPPNVWLALMDLDDKIIVRYYKWLKSKRDRNADLKRTQKRKHWRMEGNKNVACGCFERHDRERSNVAVAGTLPVVYLHAISYDLHPLSHDEQLRSTIVHSIVARPESDCYN